MRSLMALVLRQPTSISFRWLSSFVSSGILHKSAIGVVGSLSSSACLIARGLAEKGLRPVSFWIFIRLIPVVEDLSLLATLATRATSLLRLFNKERKKLTYQTRILVRMDEKPEDSRFETKYLWVPRGKSQQNFVKVPQHLKYFSVDSLYRLWSIKP